MSSEVAARATALYRDRFAGRRQHVRFFGGEPLLRFGLLRDIVASFPEEVRFSFPTNGTLFTAETADFLRTHPQVEAAVSRVRDVRLLASLDNVLISVCVPPQGAADLAPYVARLLKAGISRLNFLPAFYVRWNAGETAALRRSFGLTAGLIREWRSRGHAVEVRNAAVFNPVPLYNHGMVVDYNGDIYSSNAALGAGFKDLRGELRLGSVLKPKTVAWERADSIDWPALFRARLDDDVYQSTRRINDSLTDFVRELGDHRSRNAPAAVSV